MTVSLGLFIPEGYKAVRLRRNVGSCNARGWSRDHWSIKIKKIGVLMVSFPSHKSIEIKKAKSVGQEITQRVPGLGGLFYISYRPLK